MPRYRIQYHDPRRLRGQPDATEYRADDVRGVLAEFMRDRPSCTPWRVSAAYPVSGPSDAVTWKPILMGAPLEDANARARDDARRYEP
jgi:hypothetical protein